MLFSNKRGILPEPLIDVNGEPPTVSPENKFLGVMFDTILSFIPHLKYAKVKC